MSKKLLDAALSYVSEGWKIFPIVNKKPLTKHGHLDATGDPETIREWWSEHPNASIGAHCRASGFVAIDIDVDEKGKDGYEVLRTLESVHGKLPRDCVQNTQNGGIHILLKCPDEDWTKPHVQGGTIRGKSRKNAEGAGVDYKCNGYITLWPSPGYGWETLGQIPEIPSAWLSYLNKGQSSEPLPEAADWSLSAGDHFDESRLLADLEGLEQSQGANSTMLAIRAIFHAHGRSLDDGWSYLLEWNQDKTEDELSRQVQRISELELDGLRGERAAGELTFRTAQPSEWSGPKEIVDAIEEHKNDPVTSIGVRGQELVQLPLGGIVTLQGGTGRGKTSLLCELLRYHTGNSFVLSRELPIQQFGARLIGAELGFGWLSVLKGKVSAESARACLPAGMKILAEEKATLEALELALETTDPGALVAIDYGQIIEARADTSKDRVTKVWQEVNRIIRKYQAIAIMLSQMSRAASNASRHGERQGADAIDGGAESSAIERYSSVVLEIGAAVGETSEDGWREFQLSIAKNRMGTGDRVQPMRYHGFTGRWETLGDSQNPDEARSQALIKRNIARDKKDDKKVLRYIKKLHEQGEHRTKNTLKKKDRPITEKRVVPSLDRLYAAGEIETRSEYHARSHNHHDYYYPAHAATEKQSGSKKDSPVKKFLK